MRNYNHDEQLHSHYDYLCECPSCQGEGADDCYLCMGEGFVTPKQAHDYKVNVRAMRDEFVWEMYKEMEEGL